MSEMREIEDRPGYFVTRMGQVWSETSKKFLKPTLANNGYRVVNLPYAPGKYRVHSVHRLVAKAFIPNPNNLPKVLHGDNDRSNNSVDNLRWGTQSDNIRQSVEDKTHHEARKTHCPRNHEYTEQNTYRNAKGHRDCLDCRAMRRKRRLSPGDPRHGTYGGYSNWSCRCPSCQEAQRIYTLNRKARR